MRRLVVALAVVVAVSLVCVPVASAQSKWIRGSVVSLGPDTVTVKVLGKDMTFKVTKDTQLIARGAGRAQEEAEQAGLPGVKLAGFVKPGDGVEVHFQEAAGVMTATYIHSGLAVGEGSAKTESTGGSAHGTVTAVTGNSITVKDGARDWVFTIDSKTRVVGQGLGTLSAKFKAEGKAPTIPDLVGVKDTVYVYYQEGPNPKATEIRVSRRALK
jgi:hypothetical protein